jgi:hypothetical protein
MRITKQSDAKLGDRVSYQVAGMAQPEYGLVTGHPRLDHGLFVAFGNETRGKFCDFRDLMLGECPSWWEQDADGKWHSTR